MNLMSINSMTAMMPQGMSLSQTDKAKIAGTAEDFEAFFISRMMESMYEGVSTDGMFGGGNAERMYRSLLLNEYGKQMAKTGTVGVKDDIMRSIIEIQEMQSQGYIEGK